MTSVPNERTEDERREFEALCESGLFDPFAHSLISVALSAARQMAPQAESESEAAWVVALRHDPTLTPPPGFRLSDDSERLIEVDQTQTSPPRPKRRPNLRRLATWEAAWQAEREAES